MKVLIIEDDKTIAETFTLACKIRWPELNVVHTTKGEEGILLAETEAPDAIVLDLGLPDIDGLTVLKEIRSFSDVPIMISTVRSGEIDIIKAHEIGADTYVVKPYSQLEFLARLKSLFRKSKKIDEYEPITRGNLRFAPSMSKLVYNDKEIDLTRTEGLILYELMKNEDIVLTSTHLAEKIWGDYYNSSDENIRSYILRLRRKIEDDPRHPKLIKTKVGQGYYFTNSDTVI